MAKSPLAKAKQQAADLKAGMNPQQWLKKWGFTTSGGAYSKISRLRKRGLLPSDYTLGLKTRPKLKGTKVPKKPVKPMKPNEPIEPFGPQRPVGPIGPVRPPGPQRPERPHGKSKHLTVSKIRLLLPADLIKKLKIKAIVEDKTLSALITELVTKALK